MQIKYLAKRYIGPTERPFVYHILRMTVNNTRHVVEELGVDF